MPRRLCAAKTVAATNLCRAVKNFRSDGNNDREPKPFHAFTAC